MSRQKASRECHPTMPRPTDTYGTPLNLHVICRFDCEIAWAGIQLCSLMAQSRLARTGSEQQHLLLITCTAQALDGTDTTMLLLAFGHDPIPHGLTHTRCGPGSHFMRVTNFAISSTGMPINFGNPAVISQSLCIDCVQSAKGSHPDNLLSVASQSCSPGASPSPELSLRSSGP
eukprot:TRINITY_DN78963_c0_g1_i1.p1 TRINITY_DN78963_c0_g1~~TRINITY_DN78963_c0_g1_i1.p1  ORF type:complete len:174 (+),score=14.36 TRINITY_DN78963_c0_g1_i1:280-801(+)